jgi:hypothetical protein
MAPRSSDEGPFGHLHPDIAHLATADRAIRRAAILTDRWVSYPAAEDAIERMFGILEMPPRLRMPSVLFWAAPNMGKSSIQVYFLSLVRARYQSATEPEEKDKPWRAEGVLRVEVNYELTEKRFYGDVLRRLKAPRPIEATASRLQDIALTHLTANRIRMMILDEIQRITELRTREQRIVLNVLKYVSNQLSMSIVGFGSGEAKALIQSDPHLAERFDIVALPAWGRRERWAVEAVRERLRFIPLRKPTVVDRPLMEALFLHSGSILGRLFDLIERAAIVALDAEECLSVQLIEDVALRRRREDP